MKKENTENGTKSVTNQGTPNTIKAGEWPPHPQHKGLKALGQNITQQRMTYWLQMTER